MIVYMKPVSPFLKGLPRSDTLFGGICWGIRWVFGEDALIGLLERFDRGDPPFVISSVFPYVEQDTQRLHFLPKPILHPPFEEFGDLETLRLFKKFKKLRYLERSDFNDLINGRTTYDGLYRRFVAASGQMENPPVHFFETPGNAINRLSGAVDEGRLFFSSEASVERGGLFLLVRCNDGEISGLIQGAIRFLGDRGIGGDASVGRGAFEPEFTDDDVVEEPAGGDLCVTLSLFHPTADDLSFLSEHRDRLSYELVKRKGHVESMFMNVPRVWKESLLMFAEGSVFPVQEGQCVQGCAPVVHRDVFPVRQNGCAYAVRMAS